jgi:uncharacterized ion transporter superfamily protein YfcC
MQYDVGKEGPVRIKVTNWFRENRDSDQLFLWESPVTRFGKHQNQNQNHIVCKTANENFEQFVSHTHVAVNINFYLRNIGGSVGCVEATGSWRPSKVGRGKVGKMGGI